MATSLAVADLGKRLLEASRKGNAEEVRQLMATGAPITTDWLGTSPLHLAAQYGHTVTAEVLLRAGVSRDGKTKVEKTPLHLAAQQGHIEIAQMLVKCGATINAADMLNMTPLHWAVEAHSPVICKLLMEQGAQIDIRNKFGKTPVDIVRHKGYIDLLEILLSSEFAQQENGTKRLSSNEDSLFIESKKRARTRKFPMTAGSWTVGEMQSAEKEERLKPKEPRLASPNEAQSKQDIIGDSKSEAEAANNLSSLVDAAALVRSKVQSSNGNSKRITTLAAVEATRKRPTIVTEASVLDTLATLATASTQMATSGSETSLQAQKVASLPSTAVAPSYISIPGVQGPVQIVHAGANQPGFIHPGSLASGLPAGMIQLASPLAFNFVPGGRFQIGQSVVPGHPLGVPIQMPLQHTGVPGSHLVAVTNAQGQNVTFIGGLPPGQMAPRLANATDTTPSRPGVVMSPVSQGLTPVLTTNSIPATLPINIAHHSTLASPQQLPSSTTAATYQSETRHELAKASPAMHAGILHGITSPSQPGTAQQQQLTPTQLASAIPYANIGPGLAPIPLVPVAGLGGIQLVPQALLPTQVLSAIRAGSPSSPHLQPQFVAPGGAYTIPMSPLNLSSILPTALSLSQLPVAQQGINTLAQQHMSTSLSQQALANILTQQEAGALQTTLGNSQQRSVVAGSQPNIKATRQSLVLGGAQTDSPSKPSQHGPVTQAAETGVSTLSHDQRVIFSGAHVQQILAAQQAIAVQNTLNAHSTASAQHTEGAQETSKKDPPPQGLIQQIYNAQARLQQDTPTVNQNLGMGTSNNAQQKAVSVAQIALSAEQVMQPHFVDVTNSQPVVAAMQKHQQTTPKSMPRTEQEVTKKQPSILSQLTITTVEGKSPSSLMVTSTHMSSSNLMQKDDDMQGISPSRISPTRSRTPVSDAATEGEHVIAGTDHVDSGNLNDQMIRKLTATMGIPANSTNDAPPGSTVLSSNQALPHLQQLIYKQLQQQLETQQRLDTPQPTRSPSPHHDKAVKDEPSSQSSMPSSPRQPQSPSREFQDRTETQANAQSEYFWRVIEQENPDLKRQFAESELETELYSQDFSKQDEKTGEKNTKVEDVLVKDESADRIPSPSNVSGIDDNEERD